MTVDLGLPTPLGLDGVPRSVAQQRASDFKSDQDVRWCPGCGDYVVLSTVQSFLPTLGVARENIVFLSGIGCSSRFPYYMNTYGMHSIHGRAPAIATGLAVHRPDLSVWVVTGDGDALSIGGNHLIHTLRRNVNIKILLFNNRIYGLTKGQYSPTSGVGTVTKSSPLGSIDHPFNPVSLALGAEATFVARALDSDRQGLTEVLGAAVEHRGTALVEIFQNCPVFNDGEFAALKDPSDDSLLRLVPGSPVTFGAAGPDGHREFAVVTDGVGGLAISRTEDVGIEAAVVHDPERSDSSYAYALSRIGAVTPVGIFRNVVRPTYDDAVREQITDASRDAPRDLQALLHGPATWSVT